MARYFLACRRIYIYLVSESLLDSFYKELCSVLKQLVHENYPELVEFYGSSSISSILVEACDLNLWLLNIPDKDYSQSISLTWNIIDCYSSRIRGSFEKLEHSDITYSLVQTRDFSCFNEWLQNVVWYGNKRGDYLNGFKVDN